MTYPRIGADYDITPKGRRESALSQCNTNDFNPVTPKFGEAALESRPHNFAAGRTTTHQDAKTCPMELILTPSKRCRRPMLLALGLALMPALAAAAEPKIDLTQYRLTYADEFDSLSVSTWGPVDPSGQRPGTSKWIAHTPWKGDFGSARFADPLPGFPFQVKDGILRIIALRNDRGEWRSGLLAEADPQGGGFRQSFGYFEVRAKLPNGPGTWPAFWLIGGDQGPLKVEVDVLEHYGHAPDEFHSNLHIWSRETGKDKEVYRKEHVTKAEPGLLTGQFNTYGVAVAPGTIAFYLNGALVWETDVPPAFEQPLYPIVNLALGSGWPIDKTPNPSFMDVDYVRIYQRKDTP